MRLTDEQRMLRDTAREFAQKELAPHAAEWDRTSQFPAEALAELGRLGFMGMLVPPEYGGAGADHVGYALALEEIATARSRQSSACTMRSAACRCSVTVRRSRSGVSSCRWREATCSRRSA